MITAPSVGGDKVIHVNMLEDDPASQGTDWLNNAFVKSRFTKFEPYYDWQIETVDHNPIEPDAQRALRIFAGLLSQNDCWNDYFTPFAQLFCYFDQNRSAYVPAYAPADYVAPIFAYNTTLDNMGSWSGLLGYSDDNWVNGKQSYVYEFDTADYRSWGYGFSTTTIHEAGHHFGLSHPHDGYDSEYAFDYSPGDSLYFAWSGDESNTIMHYMDISTEFGQFDQDNMYRYEMAGYLNWSNELLATILADPNAQSVKKNIDHANEYAGKALEGFNQWKYLAAASNARLAYDELSQAANQLGITTPSMNMMRIAPNRNAPREGDPIRFPDN
jgi:hypothetical protein